MLTVTKQAMNIEDFRMKCAMFQRMETRVFQDDLLTEYFNQNSSTSFFRAGINDTYYGVLRVFWNYCRLRLEIWISRMRGAV